MTNLKEKVRKNIVYVVDSEAMPQAPSSKFLPREIFSALYPGELPQRLDYIFRAHAPLGMPEGEALALMERYPGRLKIVDNKGGTVEVVNDDVEAFEGDVDELKRPALLDLCKKLLVDIPPTPKNIDLIKLAKDALATGKKPLTEKAYQAHLDKIEEEKQAEIKRKNEEKSQRMKEEAASAKADAEEKAEEEVDEPEPEADAEEETTEEGAEDED